MKIIVMSCDKNQDLFEPYHYCMEKYWPDHPEIIYSTESITNPYYKTICCGDNSWGIRLKKCLEQIDDNIVLLTLDDIFIREIVDINIINELETNIKTNKNIGFINFEGEFRDIIYTSYNRLCNVFDAPNEYYKVSVMLNMFNKDCLYQLCNDIDAWNFEKQNVPINYLYLITKLPVINFGKNKDTCCNWGIVSGKWTNELISFFNKEGIKVDYSKREIN